MSFGRSRARNESAWSSERERLGDGWAAGEAARRLRAADDVVESCGAVSGGRGRRRATDLVRRRVCVGAGVCGASRERDPGGLISNCGHLLDGMWISTHGWPGYTPPVSQPRPQTLSAPLAPPMRPWPGRRRSVAAPAGSKHPSVEGPVQHTGARVPTAHVLGMPPPCTS
jgi:hypothetical protein